MYIAVVTFQALCTWALFRASTSRWSRRLLQFGPRDAIAVTFCGVHKVREHPYRDFMSNMD